MKFKDLKFKWIYIILALSTIEHAIVINTARIHVFDEIFYVVDAKDLLHGIPANFEHPPLVKVIMALSIAGLGDNFVAWRLPAIISALVVTGLTYLIAKKYVSERMAVFASALLSCSTIFLLVGSTGILDMPMLAFSTLGVYLYLDKKPVHSVISFGLAVLSKETGLLIAASTFVYSWMHLWFRKNKKKIYVVFQGVFLVAVFFAVTFFGLWIYDIALPSTITIYNLHGQAVSGPILINNPFSHIQAIWIYQRTLTTARNPNSTLTYSPIGWVTPFDHNAFNPLSWYWGANYVSNTTQIGSKIVNWVEQPNPFVEYTMFPLLVALPILAYRKHNQQLGLLWLWLAFTYLPWLIAGFFDKIEASFYIVSSVPALAIGTAYCFSLIKNSKLKWALVALYLMGAFVFSLYYFPINFVGR